MVRATSSGIVRRCLRRDLRVRLYHPTSRRVHAVPGHVSLCPGPLGPLGYVECNEQIWPIPSDAAHSSTGMMQRGRAREVRTARRVQVTQTQEDY